MQKNEYTCEVITPLVTYGAKRGFLELRASAIKGLMRFWWRALHGHLPLDDFRNKEGELFGASGATKSPLTIRVQQIFPKVKGETYLLPHKREIKRESYACKQSFRVVLQAKKNIEIYDLLFKLFVLLGGIGMRSRRGFGSVTIRQINGMPYDLPKNLSEIARMLQEFYKALGETPPEIVQKNSAICFPFFKDRRFPYIKKIEIGNSTMEAERLLYIIGESSSKNNCRHTGFAEGKKRFASPIIVSAIEDRNGKLRPIVTTLNSVPPINLKGEQDKSPSFKGDILK